VGVKVKSENAMRVTYQHAALKSLFVLHVTERNFEYEMPTFML